MKLFMRELLKIPGAGKTPIVNVAVNRDIARNGIV